MGWSAGHAHFGDELLLLLLMSCLFLIRLCKVVFKYSSILYLQKETDIDFCLNYFWKNLKMKITIEYSNNSISNQNLDAIILFIFEDSGLTGSGLNSLPASLTTNLFVVPNLLQLWQIITQKVQKTTTIYCFIGKWSKKYQKLLCVKK